MYSIDDGSREFVTTSCTLISLYQQLSAIAFQIYCVLIAAS